MISLVPHTLNLILPNSMYESKTANKSNQRLITKQMAAQRLSISTRTVDRMVTEGLLEKVFLRGSVRFREYDIDQIIEHGI